MELDAVVSQAMEGEILIQHQDYQLKIDWISNFGSSNCNMEHTLILRQIKWEKISPTHLQLYKIAPDVTSIFIYTSDWWEIRQLASNQSTETKLGEILNECWLMTGCKSCHHVSDEIRQPGFNDIKFYRKFWHIARKGAFICNWHIVAKSPVLNTCWKFELSYCRNSDFLQNLQEEVIQNS
jgi:hypothetical protein